MRYKGEFPNETSDNNRVDIVKYNLILVDLVEIVDIVGLLKYLTLEIIVYGRELERNDGGVFLSRYC